MCRSRAVAYRVGPIREIDVNRQAMKIPLASRIQGRSPGGVRPRCMHVDKSDEGQSRIAVDNCQNMMRVIVGHFVRAIIAAVRSRAGFTVPGGDAAGDALRPVIVCGNTSGDSGKNGRWGDRSGAQLHRADVENYHVGTAITDKQNLAISRRGISIWTGHGIYAVAA